MMLGFKGIIYPWIGSHFQVWDLNKGQFSFVSSVLRVTPRAAHSYPKFMGVHPYSHPGFLPSTFHPFFIALILSFYLSPPFSYFSFSFFFSFSTFPLSFPIFSPPPPSPHSYALLHLFLILLLVVYIFFRFLLVYNAIYCLLGCFETPFSVFHWFVPTTRPSQTLELFNPKISTFLSFWRCNRAKSFWNDCKWKYIKTQYNSSISINLGFWETSLLPLPKPTFWNNREVSVNVGLGEG